MTQLFYDSDADLSLLSNKTLAIIGYGSQGHAHALNLKDSGMDVIVGLYKGSDIEIEAKEILRIKDMLNQSMSEMTGQSFEKIEKDTDRAVSYTHLTLPTNTTV